jgi:uncharacterized protein
MPFIARYRKEAVGNLDELAIMEIMDSESEWDVLQKRRSFILAEIESQGKLSDSLRQLILGAQDTNLLEDLYLPFKQKRVTKASKALDSGLAPYADALWDIAHGCTSGNRDISYSTKSSLSSLQQMFPAGKPTMAGKAMNEGAINILSQRVAEDKQVRAKVRQELLAGTLSLDFINNYVALTHTHSSINQLINTSINQSISVN